MSGDSLKMTTETMSKFDQTLGVWSGAALAVLFGAGLVIAGLIPPVPANLTPDQVIDFYQLNASRIRIGVIIGLFGAVFMFPFAAIISVQLWRIQGVSKVPAFIQLAAGAANSMIVSLPLMLFAIATFRPERNPDTTLLLHDATWLLFIVYFPIQFGQNMGIALGVFADKSAKPVFPRWVGYLNVWFCFLLPPVVLAFYFREGPFAWNGLISFWVAAMAFFIWISCMVYALNKAVKESPH